MVAATLCLIEREREAYHLGVLRSNSSLQRIAASQAKDMVIGHYFGDNSLTGGTPWQRITASHYASGARRLSAAQNIGWATDRLATPAAMVNAWMLSPMHRKIMLTGGYRDIGVGVAPAPPRSLAKGTHGATYTAEFAARE
ncbi:MAG TPA: CAP domain-containing protein [Solirubrobacteraceae bacterium]|nr:CAP domain-containing protein [Solirubrobacteraceae bacterium]